MRESLKGWRRKFGVLTLVVALAFTGGWVKSHLDGNVVCVPNGDHVDELQTHGKIGLTAICSQIVGTQLEVTGLGVESLLLPVSSPSPAESAQPEPRMGVDIDSDALPPETLQAVMKNSAPEPGEFAGSEPRIGIEFDYDSLPPEELLAPADDDLADLGYLTSSWQWSGFYANRTVAPNGGWFMTVMIPHWFVVVPMLMVSAILFIRPRNIKTNRKDLAGEGKPQLSLQPA